MNCRQMRGILPALAEREGTPRVALEAARHLAACRSCAAELMRLRELNGLLDRLPRTEVPASFPRRVLRSLRSRGMIGLVLLILGAAGTAGGAITMGFSPRMILRLMADPLEGVGIALGGVGRTLLALFALGRSAREGFDEVPPLLFDHAVQGPASPLLSLLLIAAVAYAAAWTALVIGAARFRRERNGGALRAMSGPEPAVPLVGSSSTNS
jgi:anti-sigma factor RsiW